LTRFDTEAATLNWSHDKRQPPTSTPTQVRVWDAPTRVFHWLYAVCFFLGWLTRDTRYLDLHSLAGYTFLALLFFRLLWGLIGTTHARFTSFAAGPKEVYWYLRCLVQGRATSYTGHNPAGGWSIFLLLGFGLALGISGMVALGGLYGYGPLGGAVASESADLSLVVHEKLAWAMLALVMVHLLGVAVSSLVHRENLTLAMLTGRKRGSDAQSDVPSSITLAGLLVLAIALSAAGFIHQVGQENHAGELPASAAGDPTAAKLWKEECGSCHFPYPPGLLPASAWRAMLSAEDHFGEALGLAEPTRLMLESHAVRNSADAMKSWLEMRFARTQWRPPHRIIDTPFWMDRHRRIDFDHRDKAGALTARHDCLACHGDAASGIFSPRSIHLP
jgi:cytochrome b